MEDRTQRPRPRPRPRPLPRPRPKGFPGRVIKNMLTLKPEEPSKKQLECTEYG